MVLSPAEYGEAQRATAQGVLLLARRQWDLMDSLEDWSKVAPRMTLVTAAGQLQAATRGVGYVRGQLDVAPVGRVEPRAFAGVASDGRPLASLLYAAVVHARAAAPGQGMSAGRDHLGLLVQTIIADAGRGAAQAQVAATPHAGYLRVASEPCCQRCAVLAGKFFRWNVGFQRHPRCDCFHLPTTDGKASSWTLGGGYTMDVDPSQVRDLTAAQRQAIADGADMAQVINSHRGRLTPLATSEGTTRRGWYSHVTRTAAQQRSEVTVETTVLSGRRGAVANYPLRRTAAPRLTPEAIYRVAHDRQDAVRLLARNGYIVRGSLQDVARLANS